MFKSILAIISVCTLSIGSYLANEHIEYRNQVYDDAKARLTELTDKATVDIEGILLHAMNNADQLAADLTSHSIPKDQIGQQLKSIIADSSFFYGGSVTYKPYGYDPLTRLHSDYYYKEEPEAEPSYLNLAKSYDYTGDEYDWYVLAMANGNRWGEPYWDDAGQTFMVTYSSVFQDGDQNGEESNAGGVVTIDISMQQMKNIIEELDIGPSGFGALVTEEGNYIYHPRSEYVTENTNIRQIAVEKNDPDRLVLAEKAANHERGLMEHLSTTSGEASWLIYAPVSYSNWSLQNTFIKSDIPIDVESLRRQIIIILLLSIVFIGSTTSFIIKKPTPKTIAFLSAIVSVTLVLSIGVLWNLALSYRSVESEGGIKLADRAALASVLNKYRTSNLDRRLIPPIEIPTGIYIESMEFTNANTFSLTGLLWQMYPDSFPDDMKKGVTISGARNFRVSETETYPREGGENYVWRFQAELLEKIDYSRYPLEVEHIKIELQSVDRDASIFLVPDLSSYTLTTSSLQPGIADNVFIPGWTITDSYFILKDAQRNTNFGISRNFDQGEFPGLFFEIGIKRVFLDAFFSNLMPLIVVSIILFLVIMIPPDVDISRILGISVSVFFVVVFSHLDIRKNISIGEIFYLEYFFFVVYVAILLVPINTFRTSLNISSGFYDYQNGLIPKAIYWPAVLGVFCLITAWKFY